MDDLEQSERVREWLRTNATALTTGLVLGLGGILGWQWWQHSQVQHRQNAAISFQALQQAANNKDSVALEQLAAQLSKKFGNTPYGMLALLRLADEKSAQNDLDGATSTLNEAVRAAQNPALAALARLRLARVQLADAKPQAALDTLALIPSEDFTGLVAEVRGDALLALDRAAEAEAAYQDALSTLETGAPNRSIVEMKLADLGVALDEPGA